jgi:dienelactone hydrolase
LIRALLCLALTLSALPAFAVEPLLVEETFLPVEIKGKPYRLNALIVREVGGGPRPIMLITHGQAPDPAQRERLEPRNFLRTARDGARRGYLSIVVIRRGFGRSDENETRPPGCRVGDYGPILAAQADDLEAALKVVAERPDADASRVVALGVSVGGAAVLDFASRNPPGLKAVVNVSGGIRTRAPSGEAPPGCGIPDLAKVFARFAETTKVPSLWLYAENDTVFSPEDARRLNETYVAAGGRTDFQILPAVGREGHALFGHLEGVLHWLPAFDRFLRREGLPTFDQAALDAAVEAEAPSPELRPLLARYHGRPTEKAFAVTRSGNRGFVQFGGPALADVERVALEQCEQRGGEPCRILIRNFAVVPAGTPAAAPQPPATVPVQPTEAAPSNPP